MPTPTLLALAIPLLASGARVDVAASGQLSEGIGRLPIVRGQASEFGTETTLVLRGGVRALSARSSATLTYTPRLYLRVPNVLEDARPLVFHQVALAYGSDLTRRIRTSLSLSGATGELAYTALQDAFDPGTTQLNARASEVTQAGGSAGVSVQMTRNQSLSAQLGASYRAPLQQEVGAQGAGETIAETKTMSGTLTHAWALDSRHQLATSFTWGSLDAPPRSTQTVNLQLSYTQTLNPESSLRGSAGVNYAWGLANAGAPLFPSASGGFATRWNDLGRTWSLNVDGGVSGFLDQVTVSFRPLANLNAGLRTEIHGNLSGGLQLFASTPITKAPISEGALESQAQISVPFSYEFPRDLTLTFGVDASIRAAHLSALDDTEAQDQVRLFVTIGYALGTDPSRGGWL